MSKYQLVTEASLARVLGKYFETGFMIVSAERGCESEKKRDCTEEEGMEQEQQNKKNERAIRQDIREAGFGFVPAFGGFRELVQDKETGDVSFQDNPNPEASFVVPMKPGKSLDELRDLGMQLSAKYNQDSFLYKPPATDDNKAYFIDKYGNVETSFSNVTVGDMSQVYFTYLRKNSPNRRFSLTDPGAGEQADSEEENLIRENFVMYIPRSPKTFGEAKQRMGEIFIRVK
tara:strand:+ start:1739 stop:2431 length:693 start_codon:yes stop_codon:yes gene_type:complete